MKRFYSIFLIAAIAFSLGLAVNWASQPPAPTPSIPEPAPAKISYDKQIKPILAASCFTCHGPDDEQRKAKMRLDVAAEATKTLKSGNKAIVPGNVKSSEVIARIFTAKPKDRMPPDGHRQLKEHEKELIKQWIAQGAEYEQHWAFVAPKRPALPKVKTQGWARNAVDYFVLERLEKEGLKPSPEADRYALARRVSLDLTGLPPALAAVDKFVSDSSPDAFDKFVDQLLDSQAYGERWAAFWLDLARYADSNGFAEDQPRVIWKYRDWVVKALNQNMPFDQFTIEQIAGDMLPNPTLDQLIATAFHRNTLSQDEGGTDDEEFRCAAVVDRVNTTMQVWMGLTMNCAQCHNHKYDPFSQEEFFKLYAIFNQTEDADKRDMSPVLAEYTPKQLEEKTKLEKELADVQKQIKEAKDPKDKKLQDQLKDVQKKLGNVKPLTTPIMKELAKNKQRKTFVHIRGNFLDKGKEVGPDVPGVFPSIADSDLNRMALAKWLMDPKNPLTGRVMMNRYWEQLFGAGLVETSEDFGIRGKLPSHPELLDWLATEYTAQKWDTKKMLRLIVTSATYRQSSKLTPELLKADPDNRLFTRGPRFRSTAEVVRDQALFVSGLLSAKMYGPPARPPRPKFGLSAAFGGGTDWATSPGEDKFRRALYTEWRRSAPYPSMITFDAADRNVCAVKRPRTNTPLQALVTLNDPVYVEAAQALSRKIMADGGKSVEEKVAHGFRLCLIRPPTPKELATLVKLYQNAHEKYAMKPQEASKMATDPLGPLPPNISAADAAAWTVVGNVLLNLDEMFMKR